MTTNQELLAQIQNALGATITPSLTQTASTSDIFEAYVFSLILDAARIEGANIEFRDVYGQIPTTFVFRTSPGHIFSMTQPYTHAVIAFPGMPILESHVGVRVSGSSGVLHECDVAVLYQSEAITCRTNSVAPRSAKLIMGIECKFYTNNVPLGQARAFIGLRADLTAQDCYFVINSGLGSAEKLLAKKKRDYGTNIVPNSIITVERLRNDFQSSFVSFKAVNS